MINNNFKKNLFIYVLFLVWKLFLENILKNKIFHKLHFFFQNETKPVLIYLMSLEVQRFNQKQKDGEG